MPPEKQESSQAAPVVETPALEVPGMTDALATMPEVSEHAIAEAERQTAAEAETRTDQHGVKFDPSIHSGTLTPTGHWRKKKTSRVGTSVAPNKTAQAATATDAEKQKILVAQSNAAGAAAAETIIALARAVGGDDFNPIKDATEDERAALHDAWAQYFLATGKTFSPGWLLVAANGGYLMRRFTMPKTQTRIQKLKEKFAEFVARRRMRKNKGPAPTAELDVTAAK